MKDPTAYAYLQQPYLTRLAQALERARLRPGEVRVVSVLHDRRCPIFSGGRCACEPEVVIGPPREDLA